MKIRRKGSLPEPGMELTTTRHEFDMSPQSHPDEEPGFWKLMRCHYTEKKSSGSSYISTFSALI